MSDAALAPTERELRDGFESFVEAARRLERSYAALKRRAAEIDLQLADANAQLAASLAEREAVFRALPVGVLALGKDGAERWCNPEAERVRAAARASGGDPVTLEAGEHELEALTLRVARAALPDGGALVLLEDRSRLAHLEREVDRLDRLAGLSELALGIAHEIKNPLNGVLGFASLLERHDDPEQIRRCARRIADGMRDVDAIVKALLAFARPSGAPLVPLPIAAVAAAAAAEAGVPAACVTVVGDTAQLADGPTLTRVLANLLRNSAEAGAARVRIAVESRPDELALTIEDDGPGVDAAMGARVFEPFVTSKERGHGLGLALVARVLSFLGGSIVLANPGEPGARFLIRVPRLAPQEHGARA